MLGPCLPFVRWMPFVMGGIVEAAEATEGGAGASGIGVSANPWLVEVMMPFGRACTSPSREDLSSTLAVRLARGEKTGLLASKASSSSASFSKGLPLSSTSLRVASSRLGWMARMMRLASFFFSFCSADSTVAETMPLSWAWGSASWLVGVDSPMTLLKDVPRSAEKGTTDV